jgi:hypothetical protein
LEKDPNRRYPSALAVAEDLEHWLKHEPIRAKRSGVLTHACKWVQRNPTVAALIVSLIALAGAVSWNVWKSNLFRPAPEKSIAVLPFESLSRDSDNAFFADGVQDEILSNLARIADLKVIGRTSVMRYKSDRARDLRRIGQQLGVAHEDAIRRGRRATELMPVGKDSIDGHLLIKHMAAIYGWTGEADLALQQLAVAVGLPGFLSYGELRLDPCWDPLRSDPRFDQIVASLYRQVIEQASDLNQKLFRRDEQLQAASYHQQVRITPTSTPLLAMRDGSRIPVHTDATGSFSIGDAKHSRSELAALADSSPQTFSPNVLLRPVVQDYLLPTLAYVGGAAEVAYFAQAAVLYEHFLRRVTPIVPRFSATLIEAMKSAYPAAGLMVALEIGAKVNKGEMKW